MDFINQILDIVLHLDDHLHQLCTEYGAWVYLILFLIVFCETGLVITPFLPGDSLLFAVGIMVTKGSLNGLYSMLLLIAAAILGDFVNYWIGHHGGRRLFKKDAKILKLEHLEKTEHFYAKYGPKAIVLARFIPIFRTIAPFVAGMGRMEFKRFIFWNIAGAILWVVSLVGAGILFGGLEVVKKHFELVIVAIIVISILPAVIEVLRAKYGKPEPAANSTASAPVE